VFVGHLAVALAAKSTSPRTPLSWLVGASFGLDLLWPVLLLAGLEVVRVDPGNTAFTPLDFESYPWSHSLVIVAAWAVLVGALAWRLFGASGAGVLVGVVLVSHWLLDVVSHRPDLPLWPGGPEVGLGLWNSIPATLLAEGALFVIGVELYRRGTVARDAAGRWALAGLVALTGVIWISGPWSPPPPGPQAIAGAGLAMWLFPPWAGWIDRHRSPRRDD
jgi:membrane-bound metal-dependent hydrolase YbcI (DUF457 family)